MVLSTRASLLIAFASLQNAWAAQPSAQSPVPAQLRELPWGQLNFLHTTDTHGWHGGHLQEAQYGADWGDYISFADHLQRRADEDGSDLLVIDSGDRVEGNGLYDASAPQGRYTFDILKHQRIDVLTNGNHELYKQPTSNREFRDVVPLFKNSYIASNLDIYSPKEDKFVPLAPRFRKFTTKNQGIRIVAFGFLFNFKGNANNTIVQKVEDTIKEQWFQDAIREKEVDLFLITTHAPVRDGPEVDAIYKAIRDVKWDTPIVFFGGHTHIRDYRKLEKKAFALESGRYMETLGFLSITGLSSGKKNDLSTTSTPEYKRLYIDNNLFSLYHHSGKNESNFDTELGRNVTQAITRARKAMNLDQAFGCAPHDYWLNRAPYPSNDSILTLLERDVLPFTFKESGTPSIVLANSGAIRFDIFKGPFTIDTTFLVSPFTSGFRSVPGVPYSVASKVLKLLNNEGPILVSDLHALADTKDIPGMDDLRPACIPASQASIAYANNALEEHNRLGFNGAPAQTVLGSGGNEKPRVQGYTTSDDAGSDGDDTIHEPIRFYGVPNVIASNIGFNPSDEALPEKVDLVYNEFIQGWVLLALEYLGDKHEVADTKPALNGKTMTDVISAWISQTWACDS